MATPFGDFFYVPVQTGSVYRKDRQYFEPVIPIFPGVVRLVQVVSSGLVITTRLLC
jgi:hypothetical protein